MPVDTSISHAAVHVSTCIVTNAFDTDTCLRARCVQVGCVDVPLAFNSRAAAAARAGEMTEAILGM